MSRPEAYAAYPAGWQTTPISWLGTPSVDDAPERTRALIDRVTEARGFTPNVWRSLALGDDRLADAFGYLLKLMAREGTHLGPREKELMAVVTWVENRCLYCVIAHGAALALVSDPVLAREVAVNYRHVTALTPRERALCDFAAKLTTASFAQRRPTSTRSAPTGWTMRGDPEAIEVVSMFNYTNRLASALGLQPDPEYLNPAGRLQHRDAVDHEVHHGADGGVDVGPPRPRACRCGRPRASGSRGSAGSRGTP